MGFRRLSVAAAAALAVAALASSAAAGDDGHGGHGRGDHQRINHIVVIYEENHSFDNLYGGWEHVNGRSHAPASHTTQVDQNGPVPCLKQLGVNLRTPLAATCTDGIHGTRARS
jgi:phospholipase C